MIPSPLTESDFRRLSASLTVKVKGNSAKGFLFSLFLSRFHALRSSSLGEERYKAMIAQKWLPHKRRDYTFPP